MTINFFFKSILLHDGELSKSFFMLLQKIHRMLIKQDNEFVIDTDNIVENNPSIHKPLYYMRQTLNAK